MIQYKISKSKLEQLIEDEKPGWLTQANARTAHNNALGHYDSSVSGNWSKIKVIFMRLQSSKCAYCERQLESEAIGKYEHDVEHFRPKSSTKPWKATAALTSAGVAPTPAINGTTDPGYHLLAYNPLNYCTSCKPCNSGLKSNNFPIEGTRDPASDDPPGLVSEKAYLVNPVGDFDDPPEDLIEFFGISPMAKQASGFAHRRGLVNIKFFKLDDHRRKYLFRERAVIISSMHAFLGHIENNPGTDMANLYQQLVDGYTANSAPHANCARSFRDLYAADKSEADALINLAAEYIGSIST